MYHWYSFWTVEIVFDNDSVHSPKDMEEGLGRIPEFAPDFAERLFGEDGKIYGYKDLKVVDAYLVKCRPFIYFMVLCKLSD